jgi:hypothetical protein
MIYQSSNTNGMCVLQLNPITAAGLLAQYAFGEPLGPLALRAGLSLFSSSNDIDEI